MLTFPGPTPSRQGLPQGYGSRRLARAAAWAPLTWRGPPPHFHESVWSVWQKVCYLNAMGPADAQRLLPERNEGDRLARLRVLIPRGRDVWPGWSLNANETGPCIGPWELSAVPALLPGVPGAGVSLGGVSNATTEPLSRPRSAVARSLPRLRIGSAVSLVAGTAGISVPVWIPAVGRAQ